MSDEIVSNILAFIGEQSSPGTKSFGNENPEAPQQPANEPAKPLSTSCEPAVPQPATVPVTVPQQPVQSTTIFSPDLYVDDKAFKSFSRKVTKASASTFPALIDGHIFNTSEELHAFKHDVILKRREQRQQSNEKKIKETKMKVDALPDVDADEEHVVEHEGMTYKVSQPYAIKIGDKIKRIPKTNKKDTKRIVDEVKKQAGPDGLKELVTTKDEQFKETTERLVEGSDAEFKDMLYNHLHNEFANDQTFSKTSYIKFMRELMEENKKLKKAQQEMEQQQQTKRNYNGLNPQLFKH